MVVGHIIHDMRPRAQALADRDARRPNTVETQFRFGSMGKMFTAVAIMQLAQAGKLDLTAPIGRYLKDYPNPEIATQIDEYASKIISGEITVPDKL